MEILVTALTIEATYLQLLNKEHDIWVVEASNVQNIDMLFNYTRWLLRIFIVMAYEMIPL